ncbi:MAG: DUF2683 family protein [Nanoarchaeota archaeon]|nr:DUF2683 family protein [Nanoarchaeota archaeon]MBU1270087.1 DUF2683 family protein [Nanoarchaeota archaeon]MBU1603917.1 DUF2683 family protein [Nanoarchaeota archaeon]MBU2443423.1 DUF2683 family protein [Nanoarchaeota archaeon]
MIQARFELDDYTIRVLDVIKGKFGLKNRDEALKKLALEAGEQYVELRPNELVLREIDAIYESHKKKHGDRKMTNEELKRLLNV